MNTNTPELTTERLLLRAFRKDDLHAFYEIFSDLEVNTYLPWYPPTSLVEAEQMLKDQYLRIYEEEKGYAYAICFKSDNLPIGYLKLLGHKRIMDNEYMNAEESYHYYNVFMWKVHYATCIRMVNAVELLKGK